jgi:hypothetical protein
MADVTTPFGFPYPEGTDLVRDGAQDIQDLAEAVNAAGVAGSLGGLVAVKTTTLTSTVTGTNETFADVTGLTVSITPTDAANRILVVASVSAANQAGATKAYLNLARNGTLLTQGDAAGSRVRGFNLSVGGSDFLVITMSFLDSPGTTSALTYSVQIRNQVAGTWFVNRSSTDTDNVAHARGASSITVMEVKV